MKEENKTVYESVVSKWSRLFKTKVGHLFSLEELAQEVWLAILVAEEADTYIEGGEASLETYLGTCIRRHLMKAIATEVKHTSSILSDGYDSLLQDYGGTDAEDLAEALDLDEKLADIINELSVSKRNMRYAPFVLKRMYDMTERAIAKEAEEAGLELGKSEVHNVIDRIREVYKELEK